MRFKVKRMINQNDQYPSVEALALHEMGHAIVGALNGRTPKRVWLAPDRTGSCLGCVEFGPLPDTLRRVATSPAESAVFLPFIETRLAGPMAEAISEGLNDEQFLEQLYDRPGWGRDSSQAQELAARATGLDDDHTLNIESFEDQHSLVSRCIGEARMKLERHWQVVINYQQELISARVLDTKRVDKLILELQHGIEP